MPGNVQYVLKEYLDLVRLNFPAMNAALSDRYSYRQPDQMAQNPYSVNIFLETSDYVYLFAQNIVIIFTVGFCILVTWISFSVMGYMS